MKAPPSPSRRVRSGLFEIDLNSGEVHKNGRKLPLQGQPFRVLAMLLEHSGEVVTREELQARLWPADTYVGFDEGLNTAIRKLRVAFGDSADNPRFIETIPRCGYRFIAPVHDKTKNGLPGQADVIVNGPAGGGHGEARSGDFTGLDGQAAEGIPGPNAQVSRVRRWPRVLVVSIAAAIVFILAGIAYLRMRAPRSAKSAGQTRVMLAILPFENLSDNPDQEYFSDGLTEETITDLGQLSPKELGVIARTSAMAYKHTDKTVRQIGRELGVDYVLEGSVRREGEKVRISAQLIRVKDQTHVWARSYDRELKDLIAVQNDLGKAIAEQVQAHLNSQREIEVSRTQAVDPEAYDLYLKGRFYWNQRTPGAIKKSILYFQQATTKDPNFALAYAGLADAYNFSNIVGTYSPRESFPEARAAATKAIELDPLLAEAHAALGMEKSHYEFDFPAAQSEFLKAIELNPNSAYAHLFYSNCYLMPMGRQAEAIAENQKALELDPLSLPINNFMAMTYMFSGDYEKSYQQFQRTIAMDPSFPLAHDYFSGLLTVMGRYQEAIKEHEKSRLLSGSSPEEAAAEAAAMLKALKAGGEKGFWRQNLAGTLNAMKRGDGTVTASEVAGAYALAGDKDEAFAWLDRAYAERDGQDITLLKCDPSWKDLRGDPRFSRMLRRLGLPE
jgi:TolB-like protein/DNA-binding winged helix-turn-helix (wHTH) protein/Tfp pilus assembly protein PilF